MNLLGIQTLKKGTYPPGWGMGLKYTQDNIMFLRATKIFVAVLTFRVSDRLGRQYEGFA